MKFQIKIPNFIINSCGTPYEFCPRFADFMGIFIWYPIWILSENCWFHAKKHMISHMNYVPKLLISSKIHMVPHMNFVTKFLISWEKFIWYPICILSQNCWFHAKIYMVPRINYVQKSWFKENSNDSPYEFCSIIPDFEGENSYGTPYEFCPKMSDFM